MNTKDIITNEDYYITGGGKIHFYEEKDGYYLYNKYDNNIVTEFYIPNTINGKPVVGLESDIFEGMIKLSSFKIENDNKYFTLHEGSLYSKNMEYMYHIYPKYDKKQFRISDGVKYIVEDALCGTQIKELILPKGCEEIYQYGFAVMKHLKKIYLPKSIKRIGFKAFIGTVPEDVYYEGSESDKSNIDFVDENFNVGIINAKWHYECDIKSINFDFS